jgi:hypothetical protein
MQALAGKLLLFLLLPLLHPAGLSKSCKRMLRMCPDCLLVTALIAA